MGENYGFLEHLKSYTSQRAFTQIPELFLEHLAQKEVQGLEELIWGLDYLLRPTINLLSYAKEIAELIVEFLLEHKASNALIRFLLSHGDLLVPSAVLRTTIVKIYEERYPELPYLNKLFHLAGIYETQDLKSALRTLEALVKLRLQVPVFSSRFGYGEVKDFDWLLDCVVVRFFSGTTQSIPLLLAIKTLEVLPWDNFFYLKATNPQKLKEMAKENPDELIMILRRDLKKELDTPIIKESLNGILSSQETEEFIKFHKKTKAPKAKKNIPILEPQGFDYEKLSSLTEDGLKTLIKKSSKKTKEKIISHLLLRSPQDKFLVWEQIFRLGDRGSLEILFKLITDDERSQAVNKILNEYRAFPEAFLWCVDKQYLNDPEAIILRYLDLAINKGQGAEIRKRIITDDYALVRSIVHQLPADELLKIWERLKILDNFYPEEKDTLKRIFLEKCPRLEEKPEDYLYHTQEAINKKTEELLRLKREELPRVAQEVARARSYGDLRENYEYKAAKEKQRRLFNLILKLQEELERSRPIDFNNVSDERVSLGTKVFLEDAEGTRYFYTILGPWDADYQSGVISYLAPFAQQLLGKTVGEEVFDLEGKRYKILEITKYKP
jgi:transcription elongation GreA/GreB family factor